MLKTLRFPLLLLAALTSGAVMFQAGASAGGQTPAAEPRRVALIGASGNVGSRVESLAITKLCLENLAILRQICEEALTAKFRKW